MNDFILTLIVGQIAFIAGLLVQHYRQQRKERSKVFNSLNIPKPKFKVGDHVFSKGNNWQGKWHVSDCYYDLKKEEWFYVTKMFGAKFYEHELELVEEK